MAIVTKHCSACHEWKPVEQFSNRKKSKDGKDNRCKSCVQIYYFKNKDRITSWFREEYFPKNQERFRLQRHRWKQENPERWRANARFYSQRRRARIESLPNTLTQKEWLEILKQFNFSCAYCGNQSADLEQDHVIPVSKGGGYTKDNIVPACRSCNAKKGNRMAKHSVSKVVKPPHVPHPGSAGKVHAPKMGNAKVNLGGTKQTNLSAWNRHKEFDF